MESRQEPEKKSGVGPLTPARTATAAFPNGLLALRRSAGNAAVTAWLQRSGMAPPPQPARDEREHTTDCGHDTRNPTAGATRPGERTTHTALPGASANTGAGTPDAAVITALQRSVGNAAVSEMVHRSVSSAPESGEGPGGHDQLERPVQRLAIHDVLRSRGRPMDAGLRQEMEQRFGGSDFGSVRFHTGAEAARSAVELGAQAYTTGSHVVFDKGVERKKDVVAHELAHVEENMKGSSFKSVSYGDGVDVSEVHGESEIAAEATARRVMRSPLPSAESGGTDSPGASRKAESGRVLHPESPRVQRALQVGERDLTAEYKQHISKVPEAQHQKILVRMTDEVTYHFNKFAAPDFTSEERKKFLSEASRIKWQLAKSIVSPVGMKNTYHPVLEGVVGKHPDFGAKNHHIVVNNYTELARNLMGWVYAKDNRAREKRNANAMHIDTALNAYLNVFLRRMHRYALTVQSERMMDDHEISVMNSELRTGLSHIESQPVVNGQYDPKKAGKPVGAYIAHFDGAMNRNFAGTRLDAKIMARGGLLEVMRDPEEFQFREKMISLHDLSEYFGHSQHTPPTKGKGAVPEIDAQDQRSTAGFTREGWRRVTDDRGQNPLLNSDGTRKVDRHGRPASHPSTRNENSPTTKMARSKDMPVWAGQSFTAGRMFKMAQASGASTEEIAAVGWGIFAFWRTDFDHTTEFAYHTLHEVMDIAQNFGVPYNIDQPYESYTAIEIERVSARMGTLAAPIGIIYNEARYHASRMESLKRDLNRIWTDSEEDLLIEFERVRDASAHLHGLVQQRTASLDRWDAISDRERTALLERCIVDLKFWQGEIVDFQRLLTRLS